MENKVRKKPLRDTTIFNDVQTGEIIDITSLFILQENYNDIGFDALAEMLDSGIEDIVTHINVEALMPTEYKQMVKLLYDIKRMFANITVLKR